MKLLMILHFHLMLIPALQKKKKVHNKQIHIAYDYEFICISNS